MSKSDPKPSFRVAGFLCAVAVGLIFAPPKVTKLVRTHVRDATRPGLLLVWTNVERVSHKFRKQRRRSENTSGRKRLRTKADEWELRYRRLRIENALLREKLSKADQNSPYRGTVGQPLIVPELLQASVLGEETAKLWQAGKFIDKGTMDGVGKSALVLDDTNLLIDQGRDENLLSGQPVYSGRRVFGKVVQVGRWVSTVAKVTDARYRGWAQLGRRTSQGLLFEATGILEGRGEPLCRLELVKLRELVSVGDEVYTANRDSTLPYPMYYGKVVQVKPGTQFWEIWVKPAVNETNLQTVQVLRKKFNPVRMLGE